MLPLARTFDRQALAYRRFRPGYPPAIAELVIERARLSPGCRILEIGCGAGQASMLFASLHPRQTCVDPGAALLDQCREACAHLQGFDFVCSTFEDLSAEPASFALIYAATSFHWLERNTRFPKSHALLAPQGCLAVFTDRHTKGRNDGFFRDVQTVYCEHAPELALPPPGNATAPHASPQDARPESNPLTHVHTSSLDRELVYTSEEYVGLLHTFANHIALGPARLSGLCSAIAKLIDQRHAGRVTKILTTSVDLYQKIS